MGYAHIENLYKNQEILMFKRCFAMEKIHGCVKFDTKIMMANGEERAISSLQSGSMVLCYDKKRRGFVESEIISVLKKEKTDTLRWLKLFLDNGRVLVCTEDHQILTDNRGWVSAIELKDNDEIVFFEEK